MQNREDNANVYITGLPPDITRLEMYSHFKKAGIIVDNHETGEPQIKIYNDEKGVIKGDACITYLKEESVGLAIQFLNDSFIRPNVKIKVQKAEKMEGGKFIRKRQKGSANAGARGVEQNQKLSDDHKKEFVTLKHMFHPSEAQGDPNFYEDLKLEVEMECERKCGKIEKITVFDGNPEGVIAIKFVNSASAEKCIDIMHGRFFGGRQIVCQFFDGHTNYEKAK